MQRSSDNVAVLMAAVDLVRNLVTPEKEGKSLPPSLSVCLSVYLSDVVSCCSGYIHRQNCLKDFGVNFALQKLEKKDHKRLHLL